ncbi:hypothetical protein K439DRAFT_1619764 [Ramaria rubella]|nr:hypothetical protein K439DRAFT_1619764 [Ramaria rubella]
MSDSHDEHNPASLSILNAEDMLPPYHPPVPNTDLNYHMVAVVFTPAGPRHGLAASGSYHIELWLNELDVPRGVCIVLHYKLAHGHTRHRGEYAQVLEHVNNSIVNFFMSL